MVVLRPHVPVAAAAVSQHGGGGTRTDPARRDTGTGDLGLDQRGGEDDHTKIKTYRGLCAKFAAAAHDLGLLPREVPMAVHVEPEPWTVANGGLTSSGKCARNTLEKRYAGVIAGLYGSDQAMATNVTDSLGSAASPSISTSIIDEAPAATPTSVPVDELVQYLTQDTTSATASWFDGGDLSTLDIGDVGIDSLGAVQLIERLKVHYPNTSSSLNVRVVYSLTVNALRQHLIGGSNVCPSDVHISSCAGRHNWAALKQFRRVRVDTRPAVDALARSTKDDTAHLARKGEHGAADRSVQCDHEGIEEGGGSAVIITGTTGFIGPHLLASMVEDAALANSISEVVCIVRGNDLGAATVRLADGLAAAGKFAIAANARSGSATKSCPRIRVVLGDLAKLDHADAFGLAPATRIRLVIHCGAHVSSVLPFSALRKANADSTAWLANLALDNDAALVFVSSTSAVPAHSAEADFATPAWLDTLASGYGQSKAVAEGVLKDAAASHGLRCAILRLGLVGPATDIVSGVSTHNPTDWVSAWATAVIALGAIPKDDPRSPADMDVLPVDWCAEVCTALAVQILGTAPDPCSSPCRPTAVAATERSPHAPVRPPGKASCVSTHGPQDACVYHVVGKSPGAARHLLAALTDASTRAHVDAGGERTSKTTLPLETLVRCVAGQRLKRWWLPLLVHA